MELKFLGRGAAFNTKEGNNSAYIKTDDVLVLIDCGESVFQSIVDKQLLDDMKEVHILITHLDSDHVGSLSSLIYYCYFTKNIIPNIYYPNNKLFQLLQLQGHKGLMNKYDYNYKFLGIQENNFYRIGNITNIYPIEVPHIDTMLSYGYLIYLKSGKLLWYSGDCKEIPSKVKEFDINEWYQDTTLADYEGNVHLSLRELCNEIPAEYRNKVYCMHINCNELIEKAKSEGFNVVEVEK